MMAYCQIQTLSDGSVADATVNANRIKTLLVSGLSTFFIKGKSGFGNGTTALKLAHQLIKS